MQTIQNFSMTVQIYNFIKVLLAVIFYLFLTTFMPRKVFAACGSCSGPGEVCEIVCTTGCTYSTCLCGTQCVTYGGGGGSCRDATVNCPSGATASLGQPLYDQCLNAWGGSFCSSIGTAQRSQGTENCCGGGEFDADGNIIGCRNPTITTYACCAAGTTEQCQTVPGPDIYRTMGWSGDPTTACWGTGVYYKSSSPTTNCRNVCIDHGSGEIECGVWVCDYVVVCGQNVQACSCVSNCTAGTAPTLSTPTNGQEVAGPGGAANVNFSWNAPGSWGTEASGANRSYTLCVGTNSTDPCTGGASFTVGSGATPATTTNQSVAFGLKYWGVKANNMCGSASALSSVNSVCIEGFDVTNTAYVSNWSICDANHKHTRTCREDCGTDNCAATPLVEDCLGAVRGTLFDASDYSSCPAFNPTTGYLLDLPPGFGAPTRIFGFSDQNTTPPHPWAPLTATTTNPLGNYSIQAYAPANYVYDFSPLSDIYVTSGGPKLTCQSLVATVPSNPVTCQTQPCSLVNNMSFGFWKIYGGWWQAVGGSVHADGGIKSEIPSSLATEMSLILPNPAAGNRRGFLSYGVTKAADMLGTNPNAQVSASLWEKESKYSGQVYDWSFYDKRFNLFKTTVWGDGQVINYDDNGSGYQIFESAGSITNFNFSPTGTQKVIFQIKGDVRVTGNITVPSGAFLAIIASGTITFDPSVTDADGWFVAATISVPCRDVDSNGCDKDDSVFNGNGSFVGWNSITLGRNRGILNNTASTERFTYRHDLYTNAPKPLRIYTKYYKPFVP